MAGLYTYNTGAYWDNKAMDASLQWQCQDHLLLLESKGSLETIFDAYSEVPAHQRHVPLVRWFSEFCLGIARALNGAHDKITDRLDQDPQGDSHSLDGFYVGYGGLCTDDILFSSTTKSSEPLFSALYSVSRFGLSPFDATRSVARGPTHKLKPRTPVHRAPEYDVCTEVSLKADTWSLGCVLLYCATWFLQGWSEMMRSDLPNPEAHLMFDVSIFFETVRDTNEGQLGAKLATGVAKVSVSLGRDSLPFQLDRCGIS